MYVPWKVSNCMNNRIIVLKTISSFKSKRNQVDLCEACMQGRNMPVVRKRFADARPMENELIYHSRVQAAGLPVPGIIAVEKEVLFYEYIESRHFLDVLESWETDSASFAVWERLGDWLCTFYTRLDGIVVGSPNLRNFLLDPAGQVWGIDFEEYGPGDRVNDIALLLAYILTYSPSFTCEKQSICNFLAQFMASHLHLSYDSLQICLISQINELMRSREKRECSLVPPCPAGQGHDL